MPVTAFQPQGVKGVTEEQGNDLEHLGQELRVPETSTSSGKSFLTMPFSSTFQMSHLLPCVSLAL